MLDSRMLTFRRRRQRIALRGRATHGLTSGASPEYVDTLNQAMSRVSAEIARRSTTQQAVQASSVSASVALAGVTVSHIGDARLLLLIPILSAAFGYQWLDHHKAIQRLGEYMRTRLEPELARHLSLETSLWETHLRENGRDKEGTGNWTFPILTIFYGTALVALVLAGPTTWTSLQDGPAISSWVARVWPTTLWAIGFILTTIGTLSMSKELHGRPRK